MNNSNNVEFKPRSGSVCLSRGIYTLFNLSVSINIFTYKFFTIICIVFYCFIRIINLRALELIYNIYITYKTTKDLRSVHMGDQSTLNDIDMLEAAVDHKQIEAYSADNMQITKEILKANETGFINNLVNSNLALRPKLLINDFSKGSKVLSEITSELTKCNHFMFSIAFITMSGITPLLETLRLIEAKGITGRILTTDYLNFSEPKALKKLLAFSNKGF